MVRAPRRPAAPKRRLALPRQRRTAEEARLAILDAAERQLVALGPGGIRLKDVADDVGVSHPTVLHHFGSREALIDAVVERAFVSLQADVLTAMQEAPGSEEHLSALLERVFVAVNDRGHGRAFAWLALSGFSPSPGVVRLHDVARAAHELRRVRRAASGRPLPPFEDTHFTVLLAAFTIIAQSIFEPMLKRSANVEDDPDTGARFRAWLGRLMIAHLEGEISPKPRING